MNKALSPVLAFTACVILQCASADAQSAAHSVSPTSHGSSGTKATAGVEWDYRFDPQFQATVKPYLRWYLRYNPQVPGGRYLPRDYKSQSRSESHAGYWGHLRYLKQQYGSTPIRPVRKPSKPVYRRDVRPAELPELDLDYGFGLEEMTSNSKQKKSDLKTVWVTRNESSGTVSVMFQEPPQEFADRYAKATVSMSPGARISEIQWHDAPKWASDVRTVNGKLQSTVHLAKKSAR